MPIEIKRVLPKYKVGKPPQNVDTLCVAINAFTNEECQGFSQSVGRRILWSSGPCLQSVCQLGSFSPFHFLAFFSLRLLWSPPVQLFVFLLRCPPKKALLKSFHQDKSSFLLPEGMPNVREHFRVCLPFSVCVPCGMWHVPRQDGQLRAAHQASSRCKLVSLATSGGGGVP